MIEIVGIILFGVAKLVVGLTIMTIPTYGCYRLGQYLDPQERDPGLNWLIGFIAAIAALTIWAIAMTIGNAVLG